MRLRGNCHIKIRTSMFRSNLLVLIKKECTFTIFPPKNGIKIKINPGRPGLKNRALRRRPSFLIGVA